MESTHADKISKKTVQGSMLRKNMGNIKSQSIVRNERLFYF